MTLKGTYLSMGAVAGTTAPSGPASNRIGPITAPAEVVTELVGDGLEYASLLIPLLHLVKSFPPIQVASASFRGLALNPAGQDYQLGDLKLGGVRASIGGFNSNYPIETGPVNLTYTRIDGTEVVIYSGSVNQEELMGGLISMVRLLSTGLYSGIPQFVSAINRGGYSIAPAAEAVISEAMSESTFRVTTAIGLDTRPTWIGGVMSNPASLALSLEMARTAISNLEADVWPVMHEWLAGGLESNLSSLKAQ